MKTIKQKVLKEIGKVGGEDYLNRAIDLTISEVEKVIDEILFNPTHKEQEIFDRDGGHGILEKLKLKLKK